MSKLARRPLPSSGRTSWTWPVPGRAHGEMMFAGREDPLDRPLPARRVATTGIHTAPPSVHERWAYQRIAGRRCLGTRASGHECGPKRARSRFGQGIRGGRGASGAFIMSCFFGFCKGLIRVPIRPLGSPLDAGRFGKGARI